MVSETDIAHTSHKRKYATFNVESNNMYSIYGMFHYEDKYFFRILIESF